MNHSVLEFGELSAVPAACRTYEVAGDALELVNILAAAVRTFLQILLGIFISAVHAAVPVVID